MISGSRAVFTVLCILICLLLAAGCGNTFRPTIVSLPGTSGDPASLGQAVFLSTNPSGRPGTTTHINVSGDTNVGVVTVGINPLFLAKIGNNRAMAINGDQTVTFYLALIPLNTAINTITQPAGSLAGASAAGSSNGNIYIANSGSGSVTVIPAATNAAVGNVTVGAQPAAVATNAASNKVYVVNHGGNNVSVINTQDNAVTGPIAVGTSPIWAVTSPDAQIVFVVNQGSGTVTVIDTLTDQTAGPPITVGASPNFAFYDDKLKRLYVNNSGSNSISVIKADVYDPVNNIFPTLLATIPLSAGPLPTSLTVLADGSRAYVARGGCAAGINHLTLPTSLAACTGNLVSVVDAVGLRELRTLTVGSGAVSIASSSDSSKVYVVGALDVTTVTDTFNHPPTPPRTVSTPSITVIKTSTDTVLRRSTDPSITSLVPSFLAPAQDPNCQAAFDIHFNPTVPIPCVGQTAFMVRTFP
jgi:YVTN family beta-propeller protein